VKKTRLGGFKRIVQAEIKPKVEEPTLDEDKPMSDADMKLYEEMLKGVRKAAGVEPEHDEELAGLLDQEEPAAPPAVTAMFKEVATTYFPEMRKVDMDVEELRTISVQAPELIQNAKIRFELIRDIDKRLYKMEQTQPEIKELLRVDPNLRAYFEGHGKNVDNLINRLNLTSVIEIYEATIVDSGILDKRIRQELSQYLNALHATDKAERDFAEWARKNEFTDVTAYEDNPELQGAVSSVKTGFDRLEADLVRRANTLLQGAKTRLRAINFDLFETAQPTLEEEGMPVIDIDLDALEEETPVESPEDEEARAMTDAEVAAEITGDISKPVPPPTPPSAEAMRYNIFATFRGAASNQRASIVLGNLLYEVFEPYRRTGEPMTQADVEKRLDVEVSKLRTQYNAPEHKSAREALQKIPDHMFDGIAEEVAKEGMIKHGKGSLKKMSTLKSMFKKKLRF